MRSYPRLNPEAPGFRSAMYDTPAATPRIPATTPTTIHVPGDQPTIQAAINAAADGDIVLVADGYYKENINFSGKAIRVTSVHGASETTIDGGAAIIEKRPPRATGYGL